ncbi:MAG: hypothetical protein AB4352_12340 [Hormoscilla sp.]
MNYLSNSDQKSQNITPWIATILSLGVHGMLGVALPMISEKGEAQQTTREVNLVELTAAQQDRLPKLSPSLSPVGPTEPELEDLLANSPLPSSSPSAAETPPSISSLPSLNLPPLPPIASYIDLSSLPPIASSEPILSQLQINPDRPVRQLSLPPEIDRGPVRQLPVPPEISPIGQLPVPPDRQIAGGETRQLPLSMDLQAYRPPGVNSPFSQLPQVEPSVINPQEFPRQSERSEFEPLPVASAPRHVGPLPEKIPQQAIDELRRLQAQNRARNLEGTVAVRLDSPLAASIPTGTTVELMPLGEAERAIETEGQAEGADSSTAVPEKIPQQAIEELRRLQAVHRAELAQRSSATPVAVAPLTIAPEGPGQPETTAAVPEKIPQQAIEELRRLQAENRAELLADNDSEDRLATSQTSATAESPPATVAAKPPVSAPEATAEVAKIPDRAIAKLRELQQQFAYNPAGTTPAEALASIQTWLDASKKAAENPELLWEPKRITASYPDVACRYGLDKNATDATVGVLLDPEGKISSQPETIKSTGYALLNDIALEAASSYNFAAAGEYKAYLLEIKFSHSDSCERTAAIVE